MNTSNIIISDNKIIINSYAKINLSLDVLDKRSDGYHNVKMLMQSVGLNDVVSISKAKKDITISSNIKYLPRDSRNIAYKAAELFLSETNINCGLKIHIHKNIPVAAGLAGGSSNTAAVLTALDILFNTNLSESVLSDMGSRLGADVPYCLSGSTMLAEGIGEKLTPVAPLPSLYVVLVKPQISISTPWAYTELDESGINKHPDTDLLISALDRGDIKQLCSNMYNVFEPVIAQKYPVINYIKNTLISKGALGSIMSGSGPTVFGIFENLKDAKACCDSLYRFKERFVVHTL